MIVDCRTGFHRNVFGVPFKVACGMVEIHSARDLGRAVEAAKIRPARASRIADWRLRADHIKVEWCRNTSATQHPRAFCNGLAPEWGEEVRTMWPDRRIQDLFGIELPI